MFEKGQEPLLPMHIFAGRLLNFLLFSLLAPSFYRVLHQFTLKPRAIISSGVVAKVNAGTAP